MKIFCRMCKRVDCKCPTLPKATGTNDGQMKVRRAASLLRMTPVELILQDGSLVAALAPRTLNGNQRAVIWALLPKKATMAPALAARWELAAVFCTPEWEAQQLARVPMLPPKGEKVCFV
jgi:hypothetical protein